jgi:hypothetical protein
MGAEAGARPLQHLPWEPGKPQGPGLGAGLLCSATSTHIQVLSVAWACPPERARDAQ